MPGTEGKLQHRLLLDKGAAGWALPWWALLPWDSAGPRGAVAGLADRSGELPGRGDRGGCAWGRPVFCWGQFPCGHTRCKNGGEEKGPQGRFRTRRPRTLGAEPAASTGHSWVRAILVWRDV